MSRDEIKRGRLAGVSKQELIDTLNDFLLSLLPLGAGAVLILDEAQNLPRQVLEQIRILSNLETDKEKLLQIVLVGQLNLKDILRSAGAAATRSARVDPVRAEAADARRNRLRTWRTAWPSPAAAPALRFTPAALDLVHRCTGGIPRLINLVCDRALLCGYSERSTRVLPEMVRKAATSLDLAFPRRSFVGWVRGQAAAVARLF